MSIRSLLFRLGLMMVTLLALATFVVISINFYSFSIQEQHLKSAEQFVLISRDKEELTQIIALNDPIFDSQLESLAMRSLPFDCCQSEYDIYLSALADALTPGRSTAVLYRISASWEQFIRAHQSAMIESQASLEELQELRNLIVPTSGIFLLVLSLVLGITFLNRHLVSPIEGLVMHVRQTLRGGEPKRAALEGAVSELKFLQSSFETVISDYRGSLQSRGQQAAEMSQTSDLLEGQFQKLIEISEKPAFILDASGAIRTWNKHMVALTGIAKLQANRFSFSDEVLTGTSAQIFDDAFQMARGGIIPDEFQCEIILRGGRTLALRLQLSPQLESTLGVNRVLVVVSSGAADVEPVSSVMAPETSAVSNLLTELSSSVHRLGDGYSSEGNDTPIRQREALVTAVKWIGSQSYVREQSVLNLSELVMHFKSTAAPQLIDLDFEVTFDADISPEPIMVRGNAGSVLLALEKLFQNALESIKESALSAGNIRVELITKDAQIAVITMTDNGTGIRSEHESQIFEPFYTTKAAKGHLGLGLTHARDLIVNMSGKLGATRPSEGQGLQVTIELPLVSA
jgi:PAS domain-containing protein